MEKAMSAARDMMNFGIEPNEITINTLIKGWCKVGKMSVAMHVTNVMLKMGLYPDEITYNTLIQITHTHTHSHTRRFFSSRSVHHTTFIHHRYLVMNTKLG